MNLKTKARSFAYFVHKPHSRRHTQEPYFAHVSQVAGLVAATYDDELPQAVAWLHDVLEMAPEHRMAFHQNFPPQVVNAVVLLSDLDRTYDSRKLRKEAYFRGIAKGPGWIQTIKLADFISNVPGLATQEEAFFVKVYLPEVNRAIHLFKDADIRMRDILESVLGKYGAYD